MLSRASLVLGLAAAASAAISTPYVLECPLTYADGGVYMRKLSSGDYTYDLDGLLPANETFKLNLAVTQPSPYTCCGPDTFYLTNNTGGSTFERFARQPYIDVSSGANQPLRFTDDVDGLTGGETAAGWMNVAGFVMYSPTGHLKDVYPPPASDGSQEIRPGQGWQMVETQYSGIYQVYWDEAVYESNKTNSQTRAIGQCYASYSPTFTDDL